MTPIVAEPEEILGGELGEGMKRIQKSLLTPEQKRMESAAEKIGLSRIASLILQVDARAVAENQNDEDEMLSRGRKRLAAQLGCRPEDLQEVADSYGEQWQQFVLEERVKLGTESTVVRDVSWDRLEASVLRKLLHLVDLDQIGTLPELLAVAKAANQANRGERARGPHMGASVIQNTNVFVPGNPEAGVLPAGHLGRIQLTLAPRLVKQIEGRVVEAANDPQIREIDRIEMLTVDQIQRASEGDHES